MLQYAVVLDLKPAGGAITAEEEGASRARGCKLLTRQQFIRRSEEEPIVRDDVGYLLSAAERYTTVTA